MLVRVSVLQSKVECVGNVAECVGNGAEEEYHQ